MTKDIPYLDVQNLTKTFGALELFKNISFSIAAGQRVGLIAQNGKGKSKTLPFRKLLLPLRCHIGVTIAK